MALAVLNPIPQFFELDGDPLDAGKMYFGVPNLDPISNPITVYWDAAATIPAAQPINTLNGYPARIGAPSIIYANVDFSLLVQDRRGRQVFYAPTSADFGNAASILSRLADATSAANGAGLSGFEASNAYPRLTLGGANIGGEINVDWYLNADKTGAGDSSGVFNAAGVTGHANYVPSGAWKLNATYPAKIRVTGDGSYTTQLRASVPTAAILTYGAGSPSWTYQSEVTGLGFYGTGKVGVGYTFGKTDPATYAAGDEYKNNVRFVGSYADSLDKGVQFPFGNIGTEFYSCGSSSNRYGYYLLDNKFGGDLMHAGNKYWYAGELNNNDCGVYINNVTDGFGGVSFRDTIFENNQIAFYGKTSSIYTPVAFDNVWLEANGFLRDGTTNVTLDTWTGTTKATASFANHALVFDGTLGVYNYTGGFFTDAHAKGTNISVFSRGSRVETQSGVNGRPCVVDNADSVIYVVDPSSDSGLPLGNRVIVKGLVNQLNRFTIDNNSTNAANRAWFGPHRTALRPKRGPIGVSRRMQTVETSLGGSTYAVTGTVVEDGVLFATCNEWTIPFASTADFVAVNGTDVSMTAGWWVAAIDVKVVSGNPLFSIANNAGTTIFGALVPIPSVGEWHTLRFMGKAPGAMAAARVVINPATNGVPATFRMSAFDWVRFDTKHEAQLYVESGAFTDTVNGGGVVRITGATYTALEGDEFITANRAGSITLTLPAALDYPGRNIHVRTIQAQAVISATSNVEPLAGGALATGILGAAAGKWARLVSDGAQWMIHEAA